MRTGVFYFSLNDGPRRQRIDLPGGGYGFIRVDEVICEDLMTAHDVAEPAEDEVVMNTHDLAFQLGPVGE